MLANLETEKSGRGDADHLEDPIAHVERFADHVFGSAKFASPEGIANDNSVWTGAAAILGRSKKLSQLRPQSEDRKSFAAEPKNVRLARLRAVAQRQAAVAPGECAGQRFVLPTNLFPE